MTLKNNPWFQVLGSQLQTHPKARLFCLPYAGGAASAFSSWQQSMPAGIEVCAVQLPGRGSRLIEPCFTQLQPLVGALTEAILPYVNDGDYYLYGHSMGARLTYELACALDKRGATLPKQLFLSGARAPQTARRKRALHSLPHDEFLQELAALNGTPKEMLEHKELMELAIPILRADFEVCETWPQQLDHQLDIPLRVFGGLEDPGVLLEDLDAWQQASSGPFKRHVFPGDHFFINPQKEKLLGLIARYILDPS